MEEDKVLLHPALSLLVDGDRVKEALVAAATGEKFCYPCLSNELELMRALGLRVLELTKKGLFTPFKDFLSVRAGPYVLLTLCLRADRVLVLQLNPLIAEELAAMELYSCLSRLTTVANPSERAGETLSEGALMRCEGTVDDAYKYFAEGVVRSDVAEAAAVIAVTTDARYCYPRPPRVPEKVLEELASLLEELAAVGVKLKALRASVRGTHLVLVRLDEHHILVLEVSANTPTKHVLRAISMRELG